MIPTPRRPFQKRPPVLQGMCSMSRAILAILVLATGGANELIAGDPSYSREIRPLLATSCFGCHGPDAANRQAGLRLDTEDGSRAILESGRMAIDPGDVDASELIRRIESDDPDLVMPPSETGKSLTPLERRRLRQWVESGANYEAHWAFESPHQPAVPAVSRWPHASLGDHPIDRFLAATIVASGDEGLSVPTAFAAEAAPETLLRRLSLDLIGLPPTPSEIDAFLATRRVDPERAWNETVERLLASPHYGERQARWWLDMARYADSNGYSIDSPREIWKWRDWVIDAFNRDMPFDRFTIEQIAGDLLPAATQEQRIATGFHRNTQINEEGGIDREQFRIESVFDRVATTGTVWLGLTIGCAQCHDHKFDPITQRDYYRFFAFFNSQSEPKLKVSDPSFDEQAISADRMASLAAVHAFVDKRASELAAWEASLDDESRKLISKEAVTALGIEPAKRSPEQRRILYAAGIGTGDQEFRSLNERYLELDGRLASGPTTLVLEELPKPRATTILVQGDFTRPSEEVEPGTPAILPTLGTSPQVGTDRRATRLDLARWLVDPANPLTARVLVNRLWQRAFGRGLVETDSDFGLMGSPPSHPELLDWLAGEVVRRGWSLKEVQRLIVTSRAYRQTSIPSDASLDADPHNLLFARQSRLRLDAEIVRDVGLLASGLFSPTIGGPPVFPPIPEGSTAVGQVKRAWKVSSGPDRFRRGLYTFVFRASPPPSLTVFDAPEGYSPCTRRTRSNTPLQALTLLNDASFVEMAEALAKRVEQEGLSAAFRRCTGRMPAADEREVLSGLSSLEVARVMLNLDETLTRE
ncbi:MAG: PSD1 and planctomycete cytochrome C domain-containing protein [Planctomycetaceae bacterium]